MYPPPIDRARETDENVEVRFLPDFHFDTAMHDMRKAESTSINLSWWRLQVEEQPLFQALSTSKKLQSLEAWHSAREELIQLRILQRIEELKDEGKWSFYQLKQHKSVPRSKTHWDYMLEEMVNIHKILLCYFTPTDIHFPFNIQIQNGYNIGVVPARSVRECKVAASCSQTSVNMGKGIPRSVGQIHIASHSKGNRDYCSYIPSKIDFKPIFILTNIHSLVLLLTDHR